MNFTAIPTLSKGVRFRREEDGGAMLLIPEGALMLNPAAAATLELVDGRTSIAQIIAALTERFDVGEAEASADVEQLLDRLAERGLLVL